ncbi:TetR/AcrR family transcriptional regulator [Rhodococcus sp. BP-149]|uniref:TetR/AcrR family transcriptional regulator n=1 Tax=unclassified Rhodococcus (in: high G+C Gram-positive bacteria) TaxID=192944 RepID=UPI001C9B392B|nr:MULTISPECIES: TetR/AcrR family transcriptional regulator [unclassified Rhodococcus (in: high G+C Gram-positive bacteria)]MBY6687455.1 TetR/AcrR family transcriptional regulator [Rhodococcus sp. BP-288]MBY6696501.1 TetR/AcrR family transcriptional regulator [Rhodococcus sp. BP-188]MBY6700582.1 TetR/AcrR family transcriptional regulator [Rhodococcus sp. BP-285]MBY6704395.1 TetR/AcrR family transcriptional regulator [Rhodococcus sp. BP-283]MBY6713707.1 TetR/AcrR family transcriptional regulato
MIIENRVDDEDRLVDPRKERSRARLLDATTFLLSTGGVDAVTIDAVTKASRVARTTLYRHFTDSTQLLAAAFERLLPPVTAPPTSGTIREQLIELLHRQAKLIEEAPVQLTMLGWIALGSVQPETAGATSHPEEERNPVSSLRARVVNQYREPFDRILGDPEAQQELGQFDTDLALTQLVGPIVFTRLTGLPPIGPAERRQLVDDFLAARSARTSPE